MRLTLHFLVPVTRVEMHPEEPFFSTRTDKTFMAPEGQLKQKRVRRIVSPREFEPEASTCTDKMG
jgi:predicted NUDIX family NTP pyrophosphohydrolase